MSAGAVQTLEGLVQNRNDPPLFLQGRKRNQSIRQHILGNNSLRSAL